MPTVPPAPRLSIAFVQYLNTLLTSSGATRSGHLVLSFSFIATSFAHREPGPAGTSLDFMSNMAFERRIASIGGGPIFVSELSSSSAPCAFEEGKGSMQGGFQCFCISPAALFQHTYRWPMFNSMDVCV